MKAKLDRLSPKARLVTVLTMFSVFAVFALYTFGKAVYDIGKNDGRQIEIEHIRQLELAPPKRSINHIKKTDPQAFSIITNSTDILGKGFRIV